MMFYKELELDEIHNSNVKKRIAVRAVILQGNEILLVQSNLGDYKFPGGGVDEEETLEAALVREIKEETGYVGAKVREKVGVVIERTNDEYVPDTTFEMTSHYYLCDLTGEKGLQQLDGYELEQDYTPKWVSLNDAIVQNNKVIEKDGHRWITRENFVLEFFHYFYKAKM